ncbi:fibropellin-1-like [Strongylocentrotus purpuratus]|uniref:EGF-like domain-containing protein n=1 Tax=Strongylocentrotus purpuratus TaxID=7668 RepID=A0A7M7PQ27_STRPU|nr:fibropellin-1-like [Strongylocentrotus purpuratus]
MNGGTCNGEGNACQCNAGYTGELCGTDIDECASGPCMANEDCTDGVNMYTCACSAGYAGSPCADIDECASGPCMANEDCTDGVNMYTCACSAGYAGSPCAVDCSAPNTCMNGGTCNGEGNACQCNAGYTGELCGTDIDECASGPCMANEDCTDGVNMYTCACSAGYAGSPCADIDECASGPCMANEDCTDGVNMYTCACSAGYAGSPCAVDCSAPNTCMNGGTCNGEGNACQCNAGYTGELCGTDIDECASGPCMANEDCTDGVNMYTCACSAGYAGSPCADIDECASGPCMANEDCTDGVNMYTCACSAGYAGSPCADIDECASGPCMANEDCTDGVNMYTCACSAGYAGSPCADIDECASGPCMANEDCTDGVNMYTCACSAGYAGSPCADIDECASGPCMANEDCTDGVNMYTCACSAGYAGSPCAVDCSAPNTCMNGGTCNGEGNACQCNAGYTGELCGTDIDECASGPCMANEDCTDGVNMYTCACSAGYAGSPCAVDCSAPNTCMNGGTCNGEGNACQCNAGYTGELCGTDIDECASGPCMANEDCTDGVNMYTCACSAGYAGSPCADIDECASGPCMANEDCTDGVNMYTCACSAGYAGSPCADIDECASGPCMANEDCTDGVNMYTCACSAGYAGSPCAVDCSAPNTCMNGGTCNGEGNACQCNAGYTGELCGTDIDECASGPCMANEDCTDGVNMYTCACSAGYAGSPCAVDCSAPNTCMNGGTCNGEGNACQCNAGYTGELCGTDIDECASGPCMANEDCTDGVNMYTCACSAGYAGSPCAVDCSAPNTCMNGGTCNGEGNACQCNAGYTGELCGTDIDECASGPCMANEDCTDGVNMYTCACSAGYAGSPCAVDCSAPNTCMNGGTCNGEGNACQCNAGYTGELCGTDIDECASGPCMANEDCTDGVNMYTCACSAGYAGSPCAVDCSAPNTCMNGGTCNGEGNACQCNAGYTGELCGTDIDECASGPCMANEDCTDGVNMYTCACSAGYAGSPCAVDCSAPNTCMNGGTCNGEGNACQCNAGYTGELCGTDIDECASGPCMANEDCTDGVNMYTCACSAGYAGSPCAVDCSAPNTCMNGGTCNGEGNACQCNAGYTGELCGTDIDECASGPCMANEDCTDGVNMYTCACSAGYAGSPCAVDCSAPNTCMNGGTCNGEGNACQCNAGYTGELCGTAAQGQAKPPSPQRPFVVNNDVDRKVASQRGMAAAASPEKKGIFVDIGDHLEELEIGEYGMMGDVVKQAVEAAVKAAVPAIVQAVKEVCLRSFKEVVNPHLLHLQFRQDAIEQAGRKDNLRISGLAEEEKEETEEILIEKICKVAGETGMQLAESDISACHRLGRKVAGKKRDTVVRFVAQRKRDKVYQGRFHLKGKESFRQVFVNEDLTSTRYAVLMAAKKSAEVVVACPGCPLAGSPDEAIPQ